MFTKTARYYDRIYGFKDVAEECRQLVDLLGSRLRSPGRRLLDVACGTGLHIAHLKADFEVEHDPEGLTGRGLYIGRAADSTP